jgi:hypothetical protein
MDSFTELVMPGLVVPISKDDKKSNKTSKVL